jgi:hypothetical protein
MNLVEWFLGVPPGVELVGERPVDNLSARETTSVERSYRLSRSFHHEISSTMMMRMGYDPRSLSSADPKLMHWYRGILSQLRNAMIGVANNFPFSQGLRNIIHMIMPPMGGQVQPMYGYNPRHLGGDETWSTAAYDFTIFGWIYELYYRTNMLWDLLPATIMIRIIVELIMLVVKAIIFVVNQVIDIINSIPRVRWYWIGIQLTYGNMQKQDLDILEPKTPFVGGEDTTFIEIEDEDLRNDNFPEQGSAMGFDVHNDLAEARVRLPILTIENINELLQRFDGMN